MKKMPEVVALGYNGCGSRSMRVHHMPMPGETVFAWDLRVHKDGGKAGHQAMVVGRLGGNVAFIGKVGNDKSGDISEQWLKDDNVNTEGLLRGGSEPTEPGLILIDDNGINSIICMKKQGNEVTFEEVKNQIEAFSSAKLFITCFEIPIRTALEGAKLAKKHGMTTILNPAPMPEESLDVLPFIDIVIPNEPEAKQMAGLKPDQPFDPYETAVIIKKKYEVDSVIITLGGEGVFGYVNGASCKISPISVDVKDTTGAGDAFIGAFSWALCEGMDIKEAMEWGNYVAALSVTKKGTIDSFPTLAEVNEFINAK